MPKKKVEGEQPKVAVEQGAQEEPRQEQTQEKKSARIVTTEGNIMDKVRVFQNEAGATTVQAEYGKLREGKTAEERRAGMRILMSRPLTPEQGKVYQDLYKEDPNKAKEYAVRQAYPMFVDDAAFHKRDTTVNDRKVDYIILEKLKAEDLPKENKHLAGQWQLSFGQKGMLDTRFFGILNREELAMIRNRAEVTFDEKGQIKSIGRPMTMADIAGRVENRSLSQRQAKAAKLESVQKIDWNKLLEKNKLPEGVALTNLRFSPVKDNPDQVWLSGKANGIEVGGMLTTNETTAVRNKILTLEQAATLNFSIREKVKAIAAPVASISLGEAVKAVVARASSPSAKSFTPEQLKVLNDYASSSEPEERQKAFGEVWDAAKDELKSVNEAWVKDAHQELKDLAEGVVRSEQQGMKR